MSIQNNLKLILVFLILIFGCMIFLFTSGIRHVSKYINKERVEIVEETDSVYFYDFETEWNGKITRLSDYVGNGQYTLVDFWASWCRPCREEIPNLINIYNVYKGKGLQVVGVAVADEPEESELAIKELGVNYPQILNAGKRPIEIYGIEGIPYIVLFSPSGAIVQTNLRGNQIFEVLEQIYGE